ncbi:hypothetical protein SAMN05518855_1001717 [Paenibacillus sp. CF384]|nr:hypothetical protein SAMN05518855_1001717 [Paenibacillus sp. CF384]
MLLSILLICIGLLFFIFPVKIWMISRRAYDLKKGKFTPPSSGHKAMKILNRIWGILIIFIALLNLIDGSILS